MKNIFLTLMALTFLVSCVKVTTEPYEGKNYTNTVTGYALTTDSLDPIPNLVLSINPMQGSYTTPVGGKTVRTDSTGRFEFIYTGPSYGKIGIGFSGNNTYHNRGGYDYITPHTTNNRNIYLQPYGWLKLHVKNIDVQSPNDALIVSVGSNYEIVYGLADKTIIWKTPGNSYKEIHWLVDKNNVKEEFSDTVYIAGFDTTYFEILY